MAVVHQATGSAVNATTGALTVVWPAHQAGDIALLFVNSSAGGTTETLSTPAGFTAITTQSTGTGTAGTKVTVYWCRATSSSMASPVVTAGTDYKYGVIVTYRGALKSASPINIFGGGVKAAASTSLTVTGITTTVDNALIVQVAAKDLDSAAAFASAQTNANLTGIAERFDIGTTSGLGGGFAIWDGTKATAGATGSTTVTVTNSINAFVSIALAPELGPTIALNTTDGSSFGSSPIVEFTGTDGNGDTLVYEVQIDTVSSFDSQ